MDQDLRAQFYQAVKTLSFIKRVRERGERERDTRGQEKSYLNKFWAFSKKAVSGLVGKEEVRPAFGMDFASGWFKDRYSTPVPLAREAVSWFPNLPMGDKQFDMGPIRPRDIRSVLSRKNGILNAHLKNLESTHHFLATLLPLGKDGPRLLSLSKRVGIRKFSPHCPHYLCGGGFSSDFER